jgi:hypothetical protein
MCFNLTGFLRNKKLLLMISKIIKEENYAGENYRF